MTRRRADTVLASRGFFDSREKARAAIIAGEVTVDGDLVTKPGTLIDPEARIEVAEKKRYVSRGGHKIEGAFAEFGLSARGKHVLDVGASTGGFTDFLLKDGAARVTAVDVGYGQLAWELRQDERVAVFERTNIRHCDEESLGGPFDMAVVDVSFIGLSLVLPVVMPMVVEGGDVVALVKPQFEAGKRDVGKKGVVRDRATHERVLEEVAGAVRNAGWVVRGLTHSPIRGPQGNIEFWIWAARDGEETDVSCAEIVRRAHEELGA